MVASINKVFSIVSHLVDEERSQKGCLMKDPTSFADSFFWIKEKLQMAKMQLFVSLRHHFELFFSLSTLGIK